MIYLFISFMAFLNVTLLSILVPGGPIENRDFSGLKGITFWGFNVFLVTLGLGTFWTSYLVLNQLPLAQMMTRIVAGGYIAVYALDLAMIFPKSPTKMSKPLMLLEIVNLCMAVYLMILSTQL